MRKKTFIVDLTKIEGDGDFPCPKCGTLISPDDETENVYTVTETIIGEDDSLERVVIRCNKCSSIIHLEGLTDILETASSRVEISEILKESEPGYKTSHTIFFDGQRVSSINVEYAQKEDVKAFKRLKKLRVGDPFKGTIIIEKKNDSDLKLEVLEEIIKTVKKKFKGLKDRDIYLIEIKDGQKNVIGRASNLSEEW